MHLVQESIAILILKFCRDFRSDGKSTRIILMPMRVRCTGLNFIAHYNVIIVNELLLNFHNDESEINIKEKNRRRIKGESHALELYAFVNWTIVTDGPRPSQSAATLW